MGVFYRQNKKYDQAEQELEKAVELSGRRGVAVSDLGVCYAVAGKKSAALAIVEQLKKQYERHEALGLYLADVYAALGEKEQAFAWLEKDLQSRNGPLAFIAVGLRHDQLRAALSNDPRWNNLLQRLGLNRN